jgi:hypothetical protein
MSPLSNREAREDRQGEMCGKLGNKGPTLKSTIASHADYNRVSWILASVTLWVYFGGACSGKPVPSPNRYSEPESNPGSFQSPRSMTNGGPASIQENDAATKPVVLTWQREGGFAGFCDELKIYSTGEVRASTCKVSAFKLGRLSDEQRKRLSQWISTFGVVAIESKDSPSNDAMILKMTLGGAGKNKPSEADRMMLLDWGQNIFDQNRP